MASLRTETRRLFLLELEAFISNLKEPCTCLLIPDICFSLHLEQRASFSVRS